MRSKLVALVLIAFCAGMSEAQDATAGLENSVVKVFSSMRYRDPYKPGAKQAPADATGSGVVISGNRILTNAHVVMFAGEVQVRANQSGNKLTARVETLARDIDLAILKLEDGAFFKDHPPLPCASTLPEIKDAVMAFGYPVGGDSLSVTRASSRASTSPPTATTRAATASPAFAFRWMPPSTPETAEARPWSATR